MDTADVDLNSEAVGLTAFWRPSWGTISERWSYAMNAMLPYVRVHVSGDVKAPALGTTIHKEDTEYGLGDMVSFESGGFFQMQPALPFPLYKGETTWRMILRPTIPFALGAPVPKGFDEFDHEFGLGDSVLPFLVAPSLKH